MTSGGQRTQSRGKEDGEGTACLREALALHTASPRHSQTSYGRANLGRQCVTVIGRPSSRRVSWRSSLSGVGLEMVRCRGASPVRVAIRRSLFYAKEASGHSGTLQTAKKARKKQRTGRKSNKYPLANKSSLSGWGDAHAPTLWRHCPDAALSCPDATLSEGFDTKARTRRGAPVPDPFLPSLQRTKSATRESESSPRACAAE